MAKSNQFETDILELIFNGTTIANIADNASASPVTDLYVSLHTADPGEAGDQATNEATYTGYARVAVARTGGGWSVSGDTVTNVADITFPKATGGSDTITHVGIGTSATLGGYLMFKGALTSSKSIATDDRPVIEAGTLSLTEN